MELSSNATVALEADDFKQVSIPTSTDAHLKSRLKVVCAESLVPDTNMLVNAKGYQVSSSRSTMNK